MRENGRPITRRKLMLSVDGRFSALSPAPPLAPLKPPNFQFRPPSLRVGAGVGTVGRLGARVGTVHHRVGNIGRVVLGRPCLG